MTILVLFIFGLVMGSFLHLVADRLSTDRPITGRSYCEGCKKQLRWFELIPVLSYFFQQGSCRRCGMHLSLFYLISEVLTGLLYVLVWYFPPEFLIHNSTDPVQALIIKLFLLALCSVWVAMFLADLKYFLLPDSLQVAFAVCATGLLTVTGFSMEHVLSAVLVMLPLLAIFVITRGKGMGFGDVKLAANIGLLCGWQLGIVALYTAFLTGGLVGVVLLAGRRYRLKSHVPFGPFLLIGTGFALWYGEKILALVSSYML